MGAWFPKDKEGDIFNLWGQWGKSKCQWEKPSNSQLPFLSHSPNHLILPKIGWSSYCMGMGRVWAGNSNLGKTLFWGKSFLTFGARKHPKCMPICSYTHVLHLLMQGKLGCCFTFTFLLIFLILHAQKICFGVVKQVGKEYFHFGSLWKSFWLL